jgi:hypothetical protein
MIANATAKIAARRSALVMTQIHVIDDMPGQKAPPHGSRTRQSRPCVPPDLLPIPDAK